MREGSDGLIENAGLDNNRRSSCNARMYAALEQNIAFRLHCFKAYDVNCDNL